jgi:hypothetical protein
MAKQQKAVDLRAAELANFKACLEASTNYESLRLQLESLTFTKQNSEARLVDAADRLDQLKDRRAQAVAIVREYANDPAPPARSAVRESESIIAGCDAELPEAQSRVDRMAAIVADATAKFDCFPTEHFAKLRKRERDLASLRAYVRS